MIAHHGLQASADDPPRERVLRTHVSPYGGDPREMSTSREEAWALSSEALARVVEDLGRAGQRYERAIARARKPGFGALIVAFVVIVTATNIMYFPHAGALNWFISVAWTLPIGIVPVGIYGAIKTRRKISDTDRWDKLIDDQLIVVIPTIGRNDTLPGITRVVHSFVDALPQYFVNARIDIIIEETCEARDALVELTRISSCINIVIVPSGYRPPNGARFKARASQYALEMRTAQGESTPDIWVLHMDDDTGARDDTVHEVAHFIDTEGRQGSHLAQGILCFVKEYSPNRLTWLADAIRPADDITRFSAFTGSGHPWIGVHGELLLIRASIESEIGWDFGPQEITEDARFAREFSNRYPGKSGWFPGRSYGSSPETWRDFIRQRARWSEGLIRLVFSRKSAPSKRSYLRYLVCTWLLGPLQNVLIIETIALAIGNMNACPVFRPLLVIWALNMSYVIWAYWEGLKINSHASGMDRPRVSDRILIIALLPITSLAEGVAGSIGLYRVLARKPASFAVISKGF